MKDLMIKKAEISAAYFIAALIIEIITFLSLGLGGFFPSYFVIDIVFALCLAFFIFALPSFYAEMAVSMALLLVQVVISCINEALNKMSGIIFSLTMLNLAKEVGGVFNSDFVNWGLLYGLILFVIAVGVFMFFIIKAKKIKKPEKKYQIIILLLFLLIAQNTMLITNFGIESILKSSISNFTDDKELWETQYISKKAYKKFGFFGYYYVNIQNAFDYFIFPKDEEDEKENDINSFDYYLASGKDSSSSYNSIYTGALEGKNIILIVIESGEWYTINKEYTPTLYSMANQGIAMTEYYARDKTNHSEAMSVLGSYPVNTSIIPAINNIDGLLASTFSFSAPNIMRNSGYTTNYFHANDGDFYGRKNTFGDLYGFDHAHFLEDMTKLEGNEQKDSFYDFDKDSEIFKNYADEYTRIDEGDQAFYTMQMTLTSHGSYEDLVRYGDYKYLDEEGRNNFSEQCTVKGLEKYYDLIDGYPSTFIEDTPEVDVQSLSLLPEEMADEVYLRYKRFQAGVTDLDVGVNYLVNKLAEEGTLKDTAFVFYADHSSYYNNLNYLIKGVDQNSSYDTKLYNIPFFIWSGETMDLNVEAIDIEGYQSINHSAIKKYSAFTSKKIDKFCNSFDILPTMLQLQGYNYNENLYHGKSVFSYDRSVFVSRESGIMVNNIYYDGITLYRKENDVWIAYDYEDGVLNNTFDDEIKRFLVDAEEYYNKQSYLEKMYASDYFSQRDIYSSYTVSDKITIDYINKIK